MIDIPETDPPAELDDQKAMRDAIAVTFYKQGRLSMLQASQIMGVSRREFEDCLPRFGYAMMDARDVAEEVDGAERIAGLLAAGKRHRA